MTIRFEAQKETPGCPAGHEVAFGQVAVPLPVRAPGPTVRAATRAATALEVAEDNDGVTVRNDRLEAVVAKTDGTLTSLRWDGRELLASGPQLNVWRAPTDNDGIKAWTGQVDKPLGRWLAAGLNHLDRSVQTFVVRQAEAGRAVLEIAHRIVAKGGAFEQRETLSFSPDGEVTFANTVVADPSLPDLPRVGLALTLPPALKRLRWFGNGPHESYADRKRGTLVGLYEGSVAEQYVPYIVPQSHGNKTDVRWFSLVDKEGAGLLFSGNGLFEFSAGHYSADDLYRAAHTVDLEPRPEVFVTLDHRQRGLGTASCGPDTLPKYRIPPGTYRFTFRLRPTCGDVSPR